MTATNMEAIIQRNWIIWEGWEEESNHGTCIHKMIYIPTACFKHGIISNLTIDRTNKGQDCKRLDLIQDKELGAAAIYLFHLNFLDMIIYWLPIRFLGLFN